ncbi:MAG: hypothetical protein ACLSCV_04665 [Acutalibacteraceae bacterium]
MNFEGDDCNKIQNRLRLICAPLMPLIQWKIALEALEGGVTTVVTGPGSRIPFPVSWQLSKHMGIVLTV